jgi:hypothetical protein
VKTRRIAVLTLAAALLAPATAHADQFEPVEPANVAKLKFKLSGLNATSYGRVKRLAATYPRRSVKYVVEHAKRPTQSASGSTSISEVGPGAVSSFKWADADNNSALWKPQGITGSAAAVDDGIVGGHRELLVSWYKDIPISPAKVSFVLADSLDNTTYVHVALVIPAGKSVTPIRSHAGGIAWYGHYLYVAETDIGLRVFDTRYILGAKKLPRSADLGLPYVLPQVGLYRQVKGAGLSFSFVETDRTGPSLITGAYADRELGGQVVRWPLNDKTFRVGTQATGAWRMPASNVQGALMHNGRLLASSSYDMEGSNGDGELVSGFPGLDAAHYRWPDAAEDVHYAGTSRRVYSLTEGRGDRVVFAVDAASVGLTP